MSNPPIYILLGSFNGSKYIRQQIESIQAQTFENWKLLVSDDSSSDDTVDIVRGISRFDARVELLAHHGNCAGCVANFSNLALEASRRGAVYAMFSDQDDYWFVDKIEMTLRTMATTEKRVGQQTPVLVHTDLEVVDVDGARVHPSFMRFQGIRHEAREPLRTLLVQNFVTGCTAMVNRPLLGLALPIPHQALMHDWWLALCAASMGSVDFLPQPTIGYRRHGGNALTVRGFWTTLNPYKTDWRELWKQGLLNHGRAVLQAESLLERLNAAGVAGKESAQVVTEFLGCHDARTHGVHRVARAARLRLSSQQLPRTLVLYLRLLSWSHAVEGRCARDNP